MTGTTSKLQSILSLWKFHIRDFLISIFIETKIVFKRFHGTFFIWKLINYVNLDNKIKLCKFDWFKINNFSKVYSPLYPGLDNFE